jgi:hypothetical protein
VSDWLKVSNLLTSCSVPADTSDGLQRCIARCEEIPRLMEEVLVLRAANVSVRRWVPGATECCAPLRSNRNAMQHGVHPANFPTSRTTCACGITLLVLV